MLCIVSGCASLDGRQHQDDWFGRDKVEHFAISAAIGAGAGAKLEDNGSGRCEAAAGGLAITLVAGAGKEYYDKYIRKKFWSWKDMFWDLAGGALGSLAATGCH
jgi:putative lipoprotein